MIFGNRVEVQGGVSAPDGGASGKEMAFAGRVGKIGEGKKIAVAAPLLEIGWKGLGHRQDIFPVTGVDKPVHLIEQGAVLGEIVDGRPGRDPAGFNGHGVGGLAAEQGHHFVQAGHDGKGFQIIVHRREVGFPVLEEIAFIPGEKGGGGKDTLGAGFGAHPIPHRGQAGVRAPILQHGGDVDEIQGAQLVKMKQAILHLIRADNEVAEQLPVGIGADAHGVFQGQGGRFRMGIRTDPTDPLGQLQGGAGIIADERLFDAAKEHARSPGRGNHPVFDPGLELEMPFHPGQGINGDFGCGHLTASMPNSTRLRPLSLSHFGRFAK